MIIRRIIAGLLVIFFLNLDSAYAQNLVTITAENGKSANLDLDSIKMAVDTVEYDILTDDDGYVYVNKMSTELYKEWTPTAVVERKKYKGSISEDNLVTTEKISKRDYRQLKQGTLQAEIYDVLSKELEEKSFSQGKSTWNKYLKKQRKSIYKAWKPHKDYWDENSDYITPVNHTNVLLTVDKDGKIKDKQNDNGILWDLSQLDSLPEDYTAETFQLNVKMNYYKYAGAKMYTPKPAVKQISPVRSEVTIAKNQRPPVIGHLQFGLLWLNNKVSAFDDWIPSPPDNGIICLLAFPVVLLVCVGCIVGEIITTILCMLSGVSLDDIN